VSLGEPHRSRAFSRFFSFPGSCPGMPALRAPARKPSIIRPVSNSRFKPAIPSISARSVSHHERRSLSAGVTRLGPGNEVKNAMETAGKAVPTEKIVISTRGEILKKEKMVA
jgi:hypothetical protein